MDPKSLQQNHQKPEETLRNPKKPPTKTPRNPKKPPLSELRKVETELANKCREALKILFEELIPKALRDRSSDGLCMCIYIYVYAYFYFFLPLVLLLFL